jgi:hypothetical protein
LVRVLADGLPVHFFVLTVDEGGQEFTIEVHHGGFLVGHGSLKTYLNERVDWFDHLEARTWSALWFDDFIEQLGYQKTPSLKIYWLLPEQTIQEGFRIIESDRDTNVMSGFVHRIKDFVVYFDHEDIIGGVWDDIVDQLVTDLPKVLSPVKVTYVEKKAGEKLPVFYTNLGKDKVQQCASYGDGGGGSDDTGAEDDDFVDTGYEMEDGDADLFENYEDGHVQLKDNKKAKGSALKAFDVSRPDVDSDDVETDDEGLELFRIRW